MNKIALVSGGTDGVGLSLVKALIDKQYNVYFIGATLEKGLDIERKLNKKLAGAPAYHVEFIHLDLSDAIAVKDFSRKFLTQVPYIDLLVLSAGVLLPKRQSSPQGIEKTFAVGYLSAYLLSDLLSPLLEKSQQAKVLTISGNASFVLKEGFDFDDVNNEKLYIGFNAAMKTVHAKAVLSQILSEKYKNLSILSNTIHPGIVSSNLGRNFPWPINYAAKLAAKFMPKQSKTAIYVALSDDLKDATGLHFNGKKQTPMAFSAEYQERLLVTTEKLLLDIFK